MPAQISSILDGPAGPPPPEPAIDKPSLRRLSDAIAALPDTRLAVLVDLLVAAGIPESDATLNLDLEALPVGVFRKVWHCVYDPLSKSPDPPTTKLSVVVADVLDGESPPKVSPTPTPKPEQDELQDDDDLVPAPTVPAKRKPTSSRSGKQKRRASSVSSRSDASTTREYKFVQPAPHAGPSTTPDKVQWVAQRAGIACAYRSPIPDFTACTRTFSRIADMRRHIDHQHCEEEAQAVIDGRITRAQATLLGEDWKGEISKPKCEGCGQTFSRKDAVKRHQTETGATVVDGVCTSCPGSGNGSAGKKRARRK